MIVLGSVTAEAGIVQAAEILRAGGSALDAVEQGIRMVERAPGVYSVGQDAWPNLLGQHQLDASIMDGRTLNVGAVGALHGFVHPISVARRIMTDLPHVFLVDQGAARFADEIGAERGDLMSEEVKSKWAEWIRAHASAQDWANWPPAQLAPYAHLAVDPETAHGTVCFLARDRHGDIAVGVSTSGWGWKYPGRLGDSPVIGAGNYADNRYGAAACTGFGEMTIRAGTARSIVLYLKMGLSIQEAVREAAHDLHAVTWRYKGLVTMYALDRDENHFVLSYSCAGDEPRPFWLWRDGMATPEQHLAETVNWPPTQTGD